MKRRSCDDLVAAAQIWSGVDGRARLMVGAAGELLWHNGRARSLLTADAGIIIRDGTLDFAGNAARRSFEDYLALLTERPTTRRWLRPDRSGHLVLRAFRFDAVDRPIVCIEAYASDADASIVYVDLEQVFGLTRTEHRIALALLDGHPPHAIAVTQNVALATVRSHVKSIYAKVGVTKNDSFHGAMRRYQA